MTNSQKPAAAHIARASLVVALSLAAWPAAAQQRAFDVLHYDLTLDLPDTGRRIEGEAKLTVLRRERADTLVLDLLDLRVRRVRIEGNDAGFTQDAGHVRIAMDHVRRDTLLVGVEYGGEVKDGLIISTDSAGRWQAFGDNWPNRARHWIPSVDHPSDKATVTWTVRAPSQLQVVANGSLVEETPLPRSGDAGGSTGGRPTARTLTRWRESRPIATYLMVIAAAPLVRHDLGPTACGFAEIGRCVDQYVYVAPEQRGVLPGDFARAGDIVEFLSRTVGPFPYERLAHMQSTTRFGGMENATAIFYADALFRRNGPGTELIAHETAHQWFGDAVTEREWAHLWLSEGFATYFSALYLRHAFGDPAFRDAMVHTRQEVLRSQIVAVRPVIDTVEQDLMALLNANSYQKGGWTLHMLRTQVGDSAFFGGIRDFWAAHRHGNALTDDLQSAIETRTGEQLGWFFDQWLRRPGFASLTTGWRYDMASQRVVISVEQGDRFAPYRFPLTVAVTDAAGEVHRVRLEIPATRSSEVVLPLALSGAPRAIAFDPDAELLAEFKVK